MAKNAFKFLTWRASNKLPVSLLLKQFERIGDQHDFVLPMPIDRRFADTGSTSDGFYGERAVAHLTQLIEDGLQNYLSRTLDSWVNGGLWSRRAHFAPWMTVSTALPAAQ